MRNTEPHYDEDRYLEEQYGDDDFELQLHLEDVAHEERVREYEEDLKKEN